MNFKEVRMGRAYRSDVAPVQILLRKLGHNIRVDGDFGRKTLSAVKSFQGNSNLIPDGEVGEKTWKALVARTGVNKLNIDESMYAFSCLWNPNPKQTPYYKEKCHKDITFLHHTASDGNPYKVRDWFSMKKGVATTFVLGGHKEYDGVLLQLFEDIDHWGYHINMKDNIKVYGSSSKSSHDRNRDHENKFAKRTLSLEVCNWGYLEKRGNSFYVAGHNMRVPDDQVIDYERVYGKSFRGQRYFQRYTDKQIKGIKEFVEKSMIYTNGKIDKPVDLRWFDYSWEAAWQMKKVMVHSNVRSKTDLHPQPELIEMLNSI